VAANKISYYLSKLESLGYSTAGMLEDTGVTLDDVLDLKSVFFPEQYRRIIKNIISETNNERIGLELGAAYSLGDLGVLGYAVLSSPTIMQAGDVMMKYSDLNARILTFDSYPAGDWWCVDFQEIFPLGDLLPFAVEEYIARIQASLCQLTNGSAGFIEIHVSYDKPESTACYEKIFHCPCYFNKPKNLIYIDKSILHKPISFANEVIHKLCEEQCSKLIREITGAQGLAERVRDFLYRNPGKFPTIDGMAHEMGTNTRSLRRQLQLEGITYQNILDETRKSLAIDWLQNTNLTPKEISFMLGFSDVGNFRRAFRSWTGSRVSAYQRG
jgi:AraC-like DNA-binding protein